VLNFKAGSHMSRQRFGGWQFILVCI